MLKYSLAWLTSLTLSVSVAQADIEIRKGGSSWAKIEDDGTIRIGGSSVGTIETDGTYRKGGTSIGKIESGGTIRKGGTSWGSAANCCGSHGGKRAVAAVLTFFADDFF